MLMTVPFLFEILILFVLTEIREGQKIKGSSMKSPIPIMIKDAGVDELTKGEVTMIFYISVTNMHSEETLHLFVNSTQCCQKIAENDVDCDSMRLQGGYMGKLVPNDHRNLTLLFTNLFLHDRVGTCNIEIKDSNGATMTRKVRFNTTLVRDKSVHIPRLLQKYYSFEDLSSCTSVDEDPLNQCQPYPCTMRYNGARSYYNHTSKRCEKLPKCTSGPNDSEIVSAYILENNACTVLVNSMKESDYDEFKEGKPGVHAIAHAHGYPINVQCHNGKRDPHGRWCKCNTGWDSAPFDHKNFNMDLQVYHMCTVWLGKMSDEQARNITVLPKNKYFMTNVIIFSILAIIIILVFGLLILIMYFKNVFKMATRYDDEALDDEELVALTEDSQLSD